ncbi:hypothetical protein AAT19DRAFT_9745 [Rhodotorula toruloides]|uniref:Uncharacterized protein n=1 Tax=Rhodotorula toruloides TaxID=5286 RepID=A0A2T0A0U0_RHOTO|nr:hypothetical protein AAT19DRAFT_9745 [Rhodotorula toruloides]
MRNRITRLEQPANRRLTVRSVVASLSPVKPLAVAVVICSSHPPTMSADPSLPSLVLLPRTNGEASKAMSYYAPGYPSLQRPGVAYTGRPFSHYSDTALQSNYLARTSLDYPHRHSLSSPYDRSYPYTTNSASFSYPYAQPSTSARLYERQRGYDEARSDRCCVGLWAACATCCWACYCCEEDQVARDEGCCC